MLVVPRALVLEATRAHPTWAVVSMSDATSDPVDFGGHQGPIHRSYFDDMTHVTRSARAAGYRPPELEDAAEIVTFLEAVQVRSTEGLVTHCVAGVSRSTATLLGAAALFDGPDEALAVLDHAVARAEAAGLRHGDPVQPNPRLVAFFDDVLNLDGALLVPVLERFWPRWHIEDVIRDARQA